MRIDQTMAATGAENTVNQVTVDSISFMSAEAAVPMSRAGTVTAKMTSSTVSTGPDAEDRHDRGRAATRGGGRGRRLGGRSGGLGGRTSVITMASPSRPFMP